MAQNQRIPFGPSSITIYSPSESSGNLLARLNAGSTSVLFAGEASAEDNLSGQSPADILKVPGHGAENVAFEEMINSARPKAAIIFCQEGEASASPSNSTLERLTSSGCTVYRTDKNGNITVTIRDSNVDIKTDLKGKIHLPSNISSYVGDTSSKIFHKPDCNFNNIDPFHQRWFNSFDEARAEGYSPCGSCVSK